jgi:carboxylesterase
MKAMLHSAVTVQVRSISKPELLYPSSGRENGQSVLLIHGYTGSPHDMRYLGSRLQEAGFTVSIPRLPGHGTSRQDFLQTKAQDWLRRSVDAWLDLQLLGLQQSVGGLSMGGIIAAILGATFKPHKIVLAAPALMTTNPLLSWTPFLKYFVKVTAHKEIEEFEEEDLNFLSREYWSVDLVPQAAELYKLLKLGKKLLPRIDSPTLTIVSEKDRTVPLQVADLIQSTVQSKEKEVIVLKESPHVVVNDCEKERVADAIIQWFTQRPR